MTETARRHIVVIGGANTDLVGAPDRELVERDSNPGHVRMSAGGVGRNVAENLARLGVGVALITAFGDDAAGAALRAGCQAVGIDTSLSLTAPDVPGPVYMAVLDGRHDMAVAINDMRALDLLTPEVLQARTDAITRADLVVLDTNIPRESVEWVVAHATGPVVLDPVSVAKAPRAAGVLAGLAALTPNAAEAGALLGRSVHGIADAVEAARELVGLGVGAAFITCGTEGVAWADRSRSGVQPAPAVPVANASGAGDAFCAGVVAALSIGLATSAAAAFGTTLAGIALQDEDTVSPRVTPGMLTIASVGQEPS
jgi:pseudouridine kinase